MSVLVIEDDDDVTRCIGQILKEEGFVVHAFGHADVALTWMKANPLPTLIILDLGLPGMDGAAFRVRQRRDPRLAVVPVIIISARIDIAAEAQRLHAADFVQKPFSLEELLHVVQNRAVTVPRGEHFLRGAMRQPGR
jgi:DNA-binding response OmpR family regulator